MNPRLRSFAHGVLWFGAMNFAAIVIAAAALLAAGRTGPSQWGGALKILWGGSAAVPVQELARLRQVEKREADRSRRGSERDLERAWSRIYREKESLDARAAELRERLVQIRAAVAAEQKELEGRRIAFESARRAAEEARRTREAELAATASEKIRRIYRYMHPRAVAADLEARMATDRGKEEVAAIVGIMPERTAAEVLEFVPDPARRNEIYDLLRRPVAGRPE